MYLRSNEYSKLEAQYVRYKVNICGDWPFNQPPQKSLELCSVRISELKYSKRFYTIV